MPTIYSTHGADYLRFIAVDAICHFLADHPGAKRSALIAGIPDLANRDATTVWRHLDYLVQLGILRCAGKLKGRRYYLAGPTMDVRHEFRAIADVVRDGHTHALVAVCLEHRTQAIAEVRTGLDMLTPKNCRQHGLRPWEVEQYLELIDKARYGELTNAVRHRDRVAA